MQGQTEINGDRNTLLISTEKSQFYAKLQNKGHSTLYAMPFDNDVYPVDFEMQPTRLQREV